MIKTATFGFTISTNFFAFNDVSSGRYTNESAVVKFFEFSRPDGEKKVTMTLRSDIFDFNDSIIGFAISNSPKDAT